MTGPEHFAEAERLLRIGAGDRGSQMDAICTEAAKVHAILAVAFALKDPGERLDGGGDPVTGRSRKVGRDWVRLQPGVQGRLISFGGGDDGAWAWIDVREERDS